jgi:hypothetical protein
MYHRDNILYSLCYNRVTIPMQRGEIVCVMVRVSGVWDHSDDGTF